MSNSTEYLSAELQSQLSKEQLQVIDGMQFGSQNTLKEKVNDAALQFVVLNSSNGSAGGARGGGGGGVAHLTSQNTPWYKTWWGITLEILGAGAAVVTIIQSFS